MKENKRYLNCKYLDAGMDGMLCSQELCKTCTEFLGGTCLYFTPKDKAKKKMKDKEMIEEKQIEEMAKELRDERVKQGFLNYKCNISCSDCPGRRCVGCAEYTYSEVLYNAGYRNYKDKVVLSKEEYEYFMKDRDYWQEQYHKENEKYIKFIGEKLPELLENKGKETAEKIYKEYLCDILSLEAKEEFAKLFGVEIKIQKNTPYLKPYFVKVAEIERQRRVEINE